MIDESPPGLITTIIYPKGGWGVNSIHDISKLRPSHGPHRTDTEGFRNCVWLVFFYVAEEGRESTLALS